MPSVRYPDPFNAVMLTSTPLAVTAEQAGYIKKVLDKACSDSRFAEKAYLAIWKILTSGSVVPPVVTSLNPNTAVLGSPSFDVHVMGSGFTAESIIMFAGQPEPTTFVSSTELTTGVNMDVWLGPDSVPVAVETDGVASDPVMFNSLHLFSWVHLLRLHQ